LTQSESGNATAQCDLEWAHHQGISPSGVKDIGLAIKLYEKSAAQGDEPLCYDLVVVVLTIDSR